VERNFYRAPIAEIELDKKVKVGKIRIMPMSLRPGVSPFALCIILLASSCSQTRGKDYYVSTQGSDTGSGSIDHPFGTIQKGVSVLRAGDTLHLAEGDYQQSASFVSSGTESRPITVEGSGEVMLKGTRGHKEPIFDTRGQSHLRLRNFKAADARAAVEVNPGSHHILIENIESDRCRFCVRMKGASFVTVQNCKAANSKNAFRGSGDTHDVLFENIEARASQDTYDGMNLNYLNGDGFIFERDTWNLVFRNIVSCDHWDSGIDVKGNRVKIDNLKASGSKVGVKIWGTDVVVENSLLTSNKRQPKPAGGFVGGNGVQVIKGGEAKMINCTLADNEYEDIRLEDGASLELEDSIVARRSAGGTLVHRVGPAARLDETRVVWFQRGKAASDFLLDASSLWADPRFLNWAKGNYRTQAKSPAAELGAFAGERR
jgi:hypothetical protein